MPTKLPVRPWTSCAARYESLGKLLLGRESDWPFYYL
jgi:hypothetical protein